jgi:putative FmdB family regulatory protein
MPTYEYRCPEGHEFEVFQKMSDDPRATCPECGAQAERMLSAGAGFLFKGEGFYITDYRSESYKKAAKAEKGKASSSPDGKADAPKPEKKEPPSKGTSSNTGTKGD